METLNQEINQKIDNVTLTQNEIEQILQNALDEKKHKMRVQAYYDQVNYVPEVPKLSWHEFKIKAIERFQFKFKQKWIETDENRPIVNLLSKYFTQDKEFENEGHSLEKGIMLTGKVGVGKTAIMKLFSRNPLESYCVISCRNITNEYTNDGVSIISDYARDYPPSFDNPFKQKDFGLCFDDLGTENNKKNFGNEMNVLEEIIQLRYNNRYTLRHKTHITTNLSPQNIQEIYGERIISRLRELCNLIVFQSDRDMRA